MAAPGRSVRSPGTNRAPCLRQPEPPGPEIDVRPVQIAALNGQDVSNVQAVEEVDDPGEELGEAQGPGNGLNVR